MLKKCFVAAAILMASPALASAQDIFWSFSPTELITDTDFFDGGTRSAYIFSGGSFGFDAIDLELTTSDSNVIRFTGGEAFNPTFNVIGGTKFDFSEITVDADGSSGRLFSVNISQNGVTPVVAQLFDPDFVAGVPNGAVLLGRVDFEIVGDGTADLGFALGPQGAFDIFASGPQGDREVSGSFLNPSFGSATASAIIRVPVCVGPDAENIGDLDYSGSVDFFDIAPFISVLASRAYVFRADCDGDGAVNFLDIAPFIELL